MPRFGPVLVIGVVAVGDQRVEAVVAAGEFEHHQDLSVGFGLRGERGGGLAEHAARKRRARADADAVHAGAQQIAPAGFGKRKTILHGCAPLTQLILGLAHDQVQDQPQRVFHIGLGGGDVRRAQFLVQERDQLLARARRSAGRA